MRKALAAYIATGGILFPLTAFAQSSNQPAQPTSQQANPSGENEEVNFFRVGNDDVFFEISPFLQMDGGWASSSPNDFIPDGEHEDGDVRRARLYLDFGYYEYGGRFTYDFAALPDDPIVYAYVNYAPTDHLTLQVGQQDVPFSLQDLTGSRSAFFNEASNSATLQTPDLTGVAALYGVDNFSLSGGVFGGNINERAFDDGVTISARATYAPILTESSVLHLGLAGRGSFNTRNPFDFSSGVGSSLVSASPITTGAFEDTDNYLAANFELAATSGPFTFQSEYTLGNIETANRDSAFLHGGYAQALMFVTGGDHHEYSGKSGTFKQYDPANPVTEGGFGAVEVGGRFDYLDLSDARASDQTDFATIAAGAGKELSGTGQINWYLTKQYRLSASNTYTHVTDSANDGLDVNTTLVRFWFVY